MKTIFHLLGYTDHRSMFTRGLLLLLLFGVHKLYAEGVVNTCTEAALKAAVAGGGTVTFACDGTIALGSPLEIRTNTFINASGRNIVLSGNRAVRVLYIAPGVQVGIVGLTITQGWTNAGAGIYNDGGTLSLLFTTIATNTAFGTNTYGSTAMGGGLFNNNGNVTLNLCTLQGNEALGYRGVDGMGGGTGVPALGGAIYNLGSLLMNNTLIFGNLCQGGQGGTGWHGGLGGDAKGAGIYNLGQLTGTLLTITSNTTCGGAGGKAVVQMGSDGGKGGSGGSAQGGGLFNSGTATLSQCAITGNMLAGGNGTNGSDGTSDPFTRRTGGIGGNGGSVCGAAIYVPNGTLTLTNCTLARNIQTSGNGGAGGNGIAYWTALPANGGNGGKSGDSQGAGLWGQTTFITVHFCTLAVNTVHVGMGGGGGNAGEYTRYGNGTNGLAGVTGQTNGSGIAWLSGSTNTLRLRGVLVANNTGGSNVFGTLADDGCNLCSDGSASFSAPGSLNNTDPLLAPLANNGGETLTMQILPGSPAMDAVSVNFPTTDQRGIQRPLGLAADMGAYEALVTNLPPVPIVLKVQNHSLVMSWPNSHRNWVLQMQTNCQYLGISTQWVTVAGVDDTNACSIPIQPHLPTAFYRLVRP